MRLDSCSLFVFNCEPWASVSEAMMIYYVALPFVRIEEGLAPAAPVECPHAGAAVRRAGVMSRDAANAGAIAFSRQGSPELGEFDDAGIVRTFGDVPDGLRFVT